MRDDSRLQHTGSATGEPNKILQPSPYENLSGACSKVFLRFSSICCGLFLVLVLVSDQCLLVLSCDMYDLLFPKGSAKGVLSIKGSLF